MSHVTPLAVKYPQGAEKMLIKALFGREVPAGEAAARRRGHRQQRRHDGRARGLVRPRHAADRADRDRVGPGVAPSREPARADRHPGARGARVTAAGLGPETREVVMGGPMMGTPLASLDVPVLKGTSGCARLHRANETARRDEYACLRCGRCLEACANFLNPSRLARLRGGAHSTRWKRFHATIAWSAVPARSPARRTSRSCSSSAWRSRRSASDGGRQDVMGEGAEVMTSEVTT